MIKCYMRRKLSLNVIWEGNPKNALRLNVIWKGNPKNALWLNVILEERNAKTA